MRDLSWRSHRAPTLRDDGGRHAQLLEGLARDSPCAPLGAFVAGTLVASAADDPEPRDPSSSSSRDRSPRARTPRPPAPPAAPTTARTTARTTATTTVRRRGRRRGCPGRDARSPARSTTTTTRARVRTDPAGAPTAPAGARTERAGPAAGPGRAAEATTMTMTAPGTTTVATAMTTTGAVAGTTTDPNSTTRLAVTSTSARPPRSGVSVRVRLTAGVALLVAVALAGAGLIVFVIEGQRIEQQTVDEVDQELDEFALLQRQGIDPETGQPFTSVGNLLRLFLQRNVPDDDELLVGWVGDGPAMRFPRDDSLYLDPVFLEATRPLVTDGGDARIDSARGEALITAQPVVRGRRARGARRGQVPRRGPRRASRDDAHLRRSCPLSPGCSWWRSPPGSPAGCWRRCGCSARPPTRSGRPTCRDGIPETGNDDITALTRTVNRMLDRLESAFVGQREFLDDAGHELKTPAHGAARPPRADGRGQPRGDRRDQGTAPGRGRPDVATGR